MSNLKEFCKENLVFILSEYKVPISHVWHSKSLFANSGDQVHGNLINTARRLFQLAEDKPECASDRAKEKGDHFIPTRDETRD